jgi:uracil-DNA glycosylase
MTFHKVLLVGEAPSPDGASSFEGRSGRRLADLAGLTHAEFCERFERTNLLDAFPGRSGKGSSFPVAEARAAAARLEPLLKGRRTVFVSFRLASLFDLPADPFRWLAAFGGFAAVSPHPSGVNRWWNEPGNAEDARAFFSSLAKVRWRGPGATLPF